MGTRSTRLRRDRLTAVVLLAGAAALGCIAACQRLVWDSKGASPAGVAPAANAAELAAQNEALRKAFPVTIKPFLDTYCIECHAGGDAAAALDLQVNDAADMETRGNRLQKMAAKLSAGQMPPATADKQPKGPERAAAVEWLKGFAANVARLHAGDPGVVLAHRLSNAEYNYTIRDLTGVDIQPAREFPVDPANQAGFDNTGESLIMDPALLKKYLEAAREVSDYLVFQSNGLAFAPHPAVAETDRDKYCVNRIIDFYNRQPVDLGAYLLAAWHFEQKKTGGGTLEAVATEDKVSAKYLRKIYEALTDPQEKIGPLAALAIRWRALKDAGALDEQKKLASGLAEWVHALRVATRPTFPNLNAPGMQNGSQPFVIWKVRQIEATRYSYQPASALNLAPALYLPDTPAANAMKPPQDPPAADEYERAFERFATIFPDEYVVTERAPVYLNPNSGEGKLPGHLLNAGLHSQTGYFRDDLPLYELILSDADKSELDRLWSDLFMITDAPMRQLQSMIWFERTDSTYMVNQDFNFIRTEDTDLGEETKFARFRKVFLQDLNPRATPQARQAIADYFDYMQNLLTTTTTNRADSQGRQLASLLDWAARAYRRPLAEAEKQDLLAFYRTLRRDSKLDHEEAVRDTLVSVLMSPHFCYRYVNPPAGPIAASLSDDELASRLSYFLWSSMPDAELMQHAAKGDLHQPEVLRAQAHRMLKDDHVVNLATEFGGNWLDFRQFETHNGVDRDRFPTFDNDLREAMFQEPVRFLTHLMRDDAPLLEALYGDYTYVNAPLAKHYGMTVDVKGSDWVRVDHASDYQRGGLLPMAVFLTKNAPGLRTSPVKRGYWVVKRVLGEEIPAPPPDVPALPPDESKMELSLPQTLARHRADANCATCHVRFDSMGLIFEGYGPIGERRSVDLAGKPVEATAVFPGDIRGTGLDGLRTYVKAQREGDFLDNLCRKLLANALGRSLLLTDEALVADMRARLEAGGYKFSVLIDTIVTSPQFLNKKKSDPSAKG